MFILFVLAIFSIIVYWYAPMTYSYSYSFFCTVIFFVSSFIVLRKNCRTNLMKFEFFFLFSFFFTNYVYSIIYYPVNPYFSLFQLSFNEAYITKGTALSTVAICFFNLAIYDEKPMPILINKTYDNICVRLIKPTLFMCIAIVAFLPYLIHLAKSGVYTTGFESSLLNAVLVYIIYYYIFASFRNSALKEGNPLVNLTKEIGVIPLILIFLYTFLFLIIGSRTIPLRIVLFSLLLFHYYVHRLSNKFILFSLFVGMTFLAILGVYRSGLTYSSYWDIGQELTINNRSLYVLMEYVDEKGPTYGRTMLMGLLSALPFMQSIYRDLTGASLEDMSSAYLVTDLHYSSDFSDAKVIGLGTNIVGDIYVSFGLLGVVAFMFLLGFILKKIYLQFNFRTSSLLIYGLFFMDCIYFTRSTYLTSLRPIVWTMAIFYILNKFKYQRF